MTTSVHQEVNGWIKKKLKQRIIGVKKLIVTVF